MPTYKLGQLKMFIWRDDVTGWRPPSKAVNELINVEFSFPGVLKSAGIRFDAVEEGLRLKAWLYDTLDPNLDYEPGSRVMRNPETDTYYIGDPESKSNGPTGEVRLTYPPGKVESVVEL